MNSNSGSVTCELSRASIADHVMTRAPIGTEVAQHIETCAGCRAYRDEAVAVWSALAELSVAAPAVDARHRFDEALRLEPAQERASRRSPQLSRMLLAAGFILAAAIGYQVGHVRRSTVAVADAAQPEFLLLLYTTDARRAGQTPAEAASIVAEYSAWARGLSTEGKLVAAEELKDDPSSWYGSSPTQPLEQRVGGFFLIRARDLAEAQRITAGCPHIKHGGRVELRAIQPT